MEIRQWLSRVMMPYGASDFTAEIVMRGDCRAALDIGCGRNSHLSKFRPKIVTTGIDACADSVEDAKKANVHDRYIIADVLKDNVEGLRFSTEQETFDLVTLYGVIEHMPKRRGLDMLEKCEQLTSKYVLLETPNGFVEQGPECGNKFQRHLSGWFPPDFEGLGYKVYGTTGTKYFRGYMARAKFKVFGSEIPCLVCDVLAAWLLRIRNHPQHAFNLVAIKDVRGVPARGHL